MRRRCETREAVAWGLAALLLLMSLQGVLGASLLKRSFLAKRAAAGRKATAPYNGATFVTQERLPAAPAVTEDELNPGISVLRLQPNRVNSAGAGVCDMGDQAGKGGCLSVAKGRECMCQEAKHRPNIPLQEKFHRGTLRGLRNISDNP